MVYEIVFKKRYIKKLKSVFLYIENEFGHLVAKKFANHLNKKFKIISENPSIGKPSSLFPQIRSFIAGKNRIYYRIEKNKIVVLNMYDTRINPKKNKLK